MATDILVNERIKEGARLLREMDAADLPVTAALWYQDTDNDRWEYLVATPALRTRGTRQVYEAIQALVRGRYSQLSLDDIRVVSPRDPLIRAIAAMTGPMENSDGVRVTRNMKNNILVDDAYVYRAA